MRTHALLLAPQTNECDNQETTQVMLSVHVSGDILNEANCAAKGYPSIDSPPGPLVQPYALLGHRAGIDTHLGGSEVPDISGTTGPENDTDAPQSGDVGSSGGAEDLGAMDLPSQDTADRPLDDPTNLNPDASELPPGDIEDLWLQDTIHLGDLKTAAEFVTALQCATLDDPTLGMSDEALHRLRNLLHNQPAVVSDKYTCLAINEYLVNPLDMTYEANRKNILRCFPEADLPSYYKVKRLVADLTGVESVVHHMCVNSCIAYTGPFLDLQVCPICSQPRYDQFRL